ncbi:MAG: hypothetical protein KKB34_14565 [Bacteroidetes bacterium]|nr:hypothetical protein [Bacteroidota bacterium]
MLTIAWDVDDVLNDLMYSWYHSKWLVEKPSTSVRYEHLVENPPHNILGTSAEEYLKSLDEFRLSDKYESMGPNKEVLKWFDEYGEHCRHIVLTSVPLNYAHISASWVVRHFGKWVRSFNFIPSSRTGVVIPLFDKTKSDFLQWLNNVDVFIEDNETNYKGAKALGIKTLLVDRPWNTSRLSMNDVLTKLTKMIEKETE